MTRKCVECGYSELNSTQPELYHYKVSGLEDVYLKGGVVELICPQCGARSTKIKNVVGLHKTIASSLALAQRRLNGKELRFLREYIGYSAEDFAELIEYNTDYVRKIESGARKPKNPYELLLRLAVLKGVKAPNYSLHDLSHHEHKVQRLEFVSHDKAWKQKVA